MSKLAEAFAKREGFGIAGDMPTRDNNPGDLRHAPTEQHAPGDPDGIGFFATAEEGWAALERQLLLYADRGMTVAQAVATFAPPADHNDTSAYLDFVCQYVGCQPGTLVSQALTS